MTDKIALCADTACLENPSGLGIGKERLQDQTWLLPFADALIARKYLQEHEVAETWVVSSDSVDGINLAAALKKDNAANKVKLFIASPTGSNMSRCRNAGITPICGSKEFVSLYTAKKAAQAQAMRQVETPSARVERSMFANEDTKALPRIERANGPVSVSRITRGERATFDPLPSMDIDEAPFAVGPGARNDQMRPAPTATPERISFEKRPKKELASIPKSSDEEQEKTLSATSPHSTTKSSLALREKGATIVSIVSGSGGSGKSSISAIAALLAQNRGIRTLILDADFQFGDMKYLLGYKQTLDASDILSHPEQIESLLRSDTWPLLIAAPAQLEYSELMNERIGELLAYLKPHFDLIVINTGSAWSDLQMQLLEASNKVFFLIDQRPSSVRACNHALDLCSRCGIATTSFSYLLNFCSKKSLLSALDVSCALQGAKVREIKDGGAEVSELLGAGMAHKLAKINNAFCTSVEQMLIETLYDRIDAPLASTAEQHAPKRSFAASKTKHRARPRRRAACF